MAMLYAQGENNYAGAFFNNSAERFVEGRAIEFTCVDSELGYETAPPSPIFYPMIWMLSSLLLFFYFVVIDRKILTRIRSRTLKEICFGMSYLMFWFTSQMVWIYTKSFFSV
jgi:hypothetical protein